MFKNFNLEDHGEMASPKTLCALSDVREAALTETKCSR